MSLDFILTCSTFFIGWIFPPFFLPLWSSMIGILLLQGFNPLILLLGISISGMLSYVPLWYLESYAINLFERHQAKNYLSIWSSKFINRIKKFAISEKELQESRSWITKYLAKRHNQFAIFILAIICTAPTIPDILTVALFRHKLSLPIFLLAGFLGKFLTFLPIIFLGKGILDLIFD